jgi:hypothetical protein
MKWLERVNPSAAADFWTLSTDQGGDGAGATQCSAVGADRGDGINVRRPPAGGRLPTQDICFNPRRFLRLEPVSRSTQIGARIRSEPARAAKDKEKKKESHTLIAAELAGSRRGGQEQGARSGPGAKRVRERRRRPHFVS